MANQPTTIETHRLYVLAVAEIDRALFHAGKTRTDLAELLEVSKARVTKMLSGDENLTLHTLTRVSDALGFRWDITMRKKLKPCTTCGGSGRVYPTHPTKDGMIRGGCYINSGDPMGGCKCAAGRPCPSCSPTEVNDGD